MGTCLSPFLSIVLRLLRVSCVPLSTFSAMPQVGVQLCGRTATCWGEFICITLFFEVKAGNRMSAGIGHMHFKLHADSFYAERS